LIGFLSACYLASFVKLNDNFFIIFSKLTLAVSTIYIFGVIWLGTLIGWDKPIFNLGVAPFLLAEAFKVLLLSLLVKKLIKLKSFI
jgi:biotin transport system substrate-specific component